MIFVDRELCREPRDLRCDGTETETETESDFSYSS